MSQSTLPTAAAQLGAFCAQLAWRDIPLDVRRRVVELTLDFLGVTVRGATEASTAPVHEVMRSFRSPNASSSAVGIADRLMPAAAALVNGTAAHAVELDDVTRESSLHPGVTVFPAALAVAEDRDASGIAFLEAIVAGYEVVMRVGNALNPASTYARGFHPTGVAGAFGAAAAAARLMGLDGSGVSRAISIAGTMASGSLEYVADGSWTKRLNAGWAAHVGVMAAALSAEGFSGPATALEGRLGTLHSYTDDPRPGLLTADLGKALQISRVAIKPYACCRYNHGLIDGILRIRSEHEVDLARVRRVRLGVLTAGALLVAEPIEHKRLPANPVDAQFSAPFAAAVALVSGAAGVAQYTQRYIDDPRVRALMSVTDCYTSPEFDSAYPGRWPAHVELEMDDGQLLEAAVEFALGEPENPLPEGALRGKFRELVGDRLPSQTLQALEEGTMQLQRQPSVRFVGDALRSVSP